MNYPYLVDQTAKPSVEHARRCLTCRRDAFYRKNFPLRDSLFFNDSENPGSTMANMVSMDGMSVKPFLFVEYGKSI